MFKTTLQRTFVGVDSFSVFQEVFLRTNDQRISNIVKFSEAIGELKVEVCVVLSCLLKFLEGGDSYSRSQLVWTEGIVVYFILNGNLALWYLTECKSYVPQALATIKDGKRILFQFDRAAFSFKFLPFKVPYPVPFRLLGDEAKGWLDTTYLSPSGNLRISRGNKVGERN